MTARAGRARDGLSLFLLSATILFVELLLIRWIPANVVYIGFFNNFILLASFFGIGIGILLGRHGGRALVPPSLALAAIVVLVRFARVDLRAPGEDPFLGISASSALAGNGIVLALLVGSTAAAMALLAMPLGPLLRAMPPLRAYAIDIAGSLAGIALFAGLALLRTSPAVWFAVAAALLVARAAIARPGPLLASLVSVAAMAGILLLEGPARERNEFWSPYYRITLGTAGGDVPFLLVNGIPHQAMWRADDERKEQLYGQLYEWFPGRTFDRVLIVGAGTGSDTSIALRKGAGRVDAVEIDPSILDLGRELHPDRPYDDPRVAAHVNDGRAFLRTSTDRYDLVIFAQTDSLSLVTSTSNLRLESFLFTREAFSAVREHLTEDGIFVLYNQYRQGYVVDRIARGLELAFGSPPLVSSYALGPEVNHAVFAVGPGVAALGGGPPPGGSGGYRRAPADALEARDDWPFLYLREAAIPGQYLLALAVVLLGAGAATALAAGVTRTTRVLSPHFFLLGVAFLLLETRSLVSFSLLFGTTWIVNALVFFAILASVLAAIAVQARYPRLPERPLYAALLAALLLAYLLPPAALLIEPPAARYLLASALAFAPVFLANLVFAHSFRDTRSADVAFASNLLGAMVGGVLEWAALVTGYQALLLMVIALYAAAYILRPLGTGDRVIGERGLGPSEPQGPREPTQTKSASGPGIELTS